MSTNASSLKFEIILPEKIEFNIDHGHITIKGPNGEIKKRLLDPQIKMSKSDNKIIIESKKDTKKQRRIIGTFKAHINNMIKGVQEGYTYKLKICASHFPMNISVEKGEFIVKNFLGEKIPRKLKLKQGVAVKLETPEIVVESPDLELAGQTAASIEQLCRITNRDRRIFQDGIYIYQKPGRK